MKNAQPKRSKMRKNLKWLKNNALRIAEKNIIKDIWTLETAQLWLKMVEEQPKDILRTL